MDLVTLGMFIIDEIHFQDGRPSAFDILGGAGSFAVIGARMFRKPPRSQNIGWTLHKGSDFPLSMQRQIDSWRTSCNFVDTPNRLTTRGWNKYGDDEERAFRYTTEKFRIDQTQLTKQMLLSQCFHLICTSTRCINLVEGILAERGKVIDSQTHTLKQPLFVWEPVPDSCNPDELENLITALRYVDVVSPNHHELAALLRTGEESNGTLDTEEAVISSSSRLLQGFQDKQGAVVVRCGERGCYVASQSFCGFLPAYHQRSSDGSVIDPTGAGNAFLGAFGIGMLDAGQVDTNPYRMGAIYGSIAAGCAVEQVGLPSFKASDATVEFWNDVSTEARWKKYQDLLKIQDCKGPQDR